MTNARIAICFLLAALVGVLWLIYAAPTIRVIPGDWTALPVAVAVFMVAAVGLYQPGEATK